MAEIKKYEKIDKQIQIFRKTRKNLDESEEKARCHCLHQKRNEPSLVRRNNMYYTCTICGKDNINLSGAVLDKDKLTGAIEAIDNACDIIKLNLREDNPDDESIRVKVRKTQFFIRFMLMPLVDSLKKRNNKQKKNHNNEDSGWGKSKVI